MGNFLDKIIPAFAWLLAIFVPLGLWKLFDIVVWLVQHIKVIYE